MSDVWIVSMVLAWVVIALLVAVVLSLLRQLGVIRALIGATPAAGYDDVAPVALYDEADHFGGEPTLLVFHQDGCAGCEEIPAALAALERDAGVEARIVSVSGQADHLPRELRAHSTPAAVGVSREGLVCVLGRPETLEQLREAATAVAGAIVVSPGSQRVTGWGVTAPFYEAGLSHAGGAP
jgi:hypothetical protein